MKTVFTTGEAAKICKLSQKTIIRCFDSGHLKGFRVPGSRFRRIPQEQLYVFMRDNGIPLDALENGKLAKVLVVTQQEGLVENLKGALSSELTFEVIEVASGFDAGIKILIPHLNCVIVDFSIGRTEALQICQNIRRNEKFKDVILIALLLDDGSSTSFDRSSVDETFKKPFDVALLAERLQTLISAKKELV